jgi:hypothetical protein
MSVYDMVVGAVQASLGAALAWSVYRSQHEQRAYARTQKESAR